MWGWTKESCIVVLNSSDLSLFDLIMDFWKIKSHLLDDGFRVTSSNYGSILVFQHIKIFNMWSPSRRQVKFLNDLELCLSNIKLTFRIIHDHISASPFVVIENILCKSALHCGLTFTLATASCQGLLLDGFVTCNEFYRRLMNHNKLLIFQLLSTVSVQNCLDGVSNLTFHLRVSTFVVKQDWSWNMSW